MAKYWNIFGHGILNQQFIVEDNFKCHNNPYTLPDNTFINVYVFRYTEGETLGQKVFNYKPLMRSKLSPDGTKLYVSTEHGTIFMINNVDFSTLGDDHVTFSPHRFHRMAERQMLHQCLNSFGRNKVEVIKDWPTGDDALVIASLQVSLD